MSSPSSYGSPQDWSQIIAGGAQGAGSAMQSAASNAGSKYEAKEAKRRTLANLMNSVLKRNQALFRVGQDYSDDMTDMKSNAMQQVARGFIQSLQGSTN